MLRLPDELRRRIDAWAADGYPLETCGLLIGREEGGIVEVGDVTLARNLNTERAQDRYELDPEDFLAADARARERNRSIVGIWHSHPDHPAKPSETDRACAWEGYSYVIVAVSALGTDDFRAWRLKDRGFVEEELCRA